MVNNNQGDKNGIKRNMEKLREVLNEICAMEEGNKTSKKRLILSQKLDQLIVEYMNRDKE
ncbi:aspartyl-phosphate phosphatase Spo0E family protein [Clostridium sp. C2-6-12]|uniref:aspartyl-phosphate phosphatase Spo0E family protein n=1 Tax=Clostridium sp. C2-6-12 TaxID=2698832 RepID=UPI00136AAE39|nr:aspartyl-phosphate phosphatase Spo0E family protein [Clostridium sp. C2-6-12]